MNKRIFAIFSIAIFLIVSIGIISAADTQDDLSADADAVSSSKVIPVKIVWDDAGNTGARPASVTVSLIKDGAVVDTVTLSESNSWSATFNAQSGGSFKVTQSGSLADYSVSISGSADSGFVIVNQIKADALGASENEAPIAENASDDSDAADDQLSNDTDETNATDSDDSNATDENSTDDNSTDENSTDDSNATDGNSTVDNQTDNTPAKNPVTKEQIKKVVKPIKKNNVTKTQLRNTGIPLVVLVVAAFAAVFVPFSRNKK